MYATLGQPILRHDGRVVAIIMPRRTIFLDRDGVINKAVFATGGRARIRNRRGRRRIAQASTYGGLQAVCGNEPARRGSRSHVRGIVARNDRQNHGHAPGRCG